MILNAGKRSVRTILVTSAIVRSVQSVHIISQSVTTTSTIITQVAKRTLTPGYTEGVIECFLPDNPEDMTKKEEREWIKQNNKRMKAICKFLNENDL